MSENTQDTSTPETAPYLIIDVGGEREKFLAYDRINDWALAEMQEAAESNNLIKQAVASRNLALAHIQPEEHARFDAYMRRHGLDAEVGDKLNDALFALWNGETNLPKEPSSDSSTSTGSTDSSSTEPSSVEDTEKAAKTPAAKKAAKKAGSSSQG
jgi:hypothetical protein